MAIQQFSESLPIMLYRALDAIMPRFRLIFSDFGLTEQQWRVLRVLWDNDQIPLGQLAELALIPAPSLVGIIDRLQKMDLVVRQRSDRDRRTVFIRATKQGRDLEAQIMPRVQATYLELKKSVGADVWLNLLQGLQALTSFEISAAQTVNSRSHVPQLNTTPTELPVATQLNDL